MAEAERKCTLRTKSSELTSPGLTEAKSFMGGKPMAQTQPTSLSISNVGFSKAVTLDDGGRQETDPGIWKEKSEMRRPISDRQAQASLEGGVQGWAGGDGDGEHRAGSVKLLAPPGRSRAHLRQGEGHSCSCGLGEATRGIPRIKYAGSS